MNLTLGIVLPVCNAESTLRYQVQDLLDTLPDLVSRFELMIVDDGSTDHTGDIARDLAIEYPQVRVLRQPQRLGMQAAVDAAVSSMDSDMFLVQPSGEPLRGSELRKAIERCQTFDAQCVGVSPDLLGRLAEWGQALEGAAHRLPNRKTGAPPSASTQNSAAPIMRRRIWHRQKPATSLRNAPAVKPAD